MAKNNFARAAHFFVHFFVVVVTRLHRETLRKKCHMFSEKEFAHCIPVGFLFHVLPLIFTSLAANISHLLTTAIKFSRCVSNNDICLLCFSSPALALSLLSTSA